MKYAMNFGEVRVQTLREMPLQEDICDTPAALEKFIRENILTSPSFNPDKECFFVVFLNTRRRVVGFELVSMGTLDQVLVHPRDVFRAAIVANSHGIAMFHNHPSGNPSPSDADIRMTREIIRAGQLLKIEVLDHLIGGDKFTSLRELGYFSY